MTICLVFADSSGNISLLDEKFSHLSELNELKYNGFSHLVVNGGHNNMSSKSCVYSVSDSGLKLEFSDEKISDFSTCITVVNEKQRTAMEEAGVNYVFMTIYEITYNFIKCLFLI